MSHILAHLRATTLRGLFGLAILLSSGIAPASVVFNWQQQGGAGDFYSGYSTNKQNPGVETGSFVSLTTAGKWISEVNTTNSNFHVFASAEIDGVAQIIAWTDYIRVPRHTEIPIVFSYFLPLSGVVTQLHIGESISAGRFVGLNDGAGTNFVFDNAVSAVPLPAPWILMTTGLLALFAATKSKRAARPIG